MFIIVRVIESRLNMQNSQVTAFITCVISMLVEYKQLNRSKWLMKLIKRKKIKNMSDIVENIGEA